MFAPAKRRFYNRILAKVHSHQIFFKLKKEETIFFLKKDLKSIVWIKKGFYICTRFGRKDSKKRKTKFINILN